MTTSALPFPAPIARQVAFYAPADMRGKWHAAHQVVHTPFCGQAVELAGEDTVIRTAAGDTTAHPLLCRKCLRLACSPWVSGVGAQS